MSGPAARVALVLPLAIRTALAGRAAGPRPLGPGRRPAPAQAVPGGGTDAARGPGEAFGVPLLMSPFWLAVVLLLPAQDDPALAAAKSRQESVRTAFIKFKRTEFVPQDGITDAAAPPGPGAPPPPDDVTRESVNLLVLDGAKFRFEDNHPVSPTGGRWVNQRVVHAFDGSVTATLWPWGLSGSASPAGAVADGAPHVSVLPFPLAPLGQTLRALDPALNPYRRTLMGPTGNTLLLDGAPCREYRLDVPIRLWLDPDRDYVARRFVTGARRLDVTYRQVSGVWVPDSWTVSRLGPGGDARVTDRVEVLEVNLNEPQDPAQFSVRFPPGCVVHDSRTTPPLDFLVEPDGRMRELPRAEEAEIPPPPRGPAGPWYWKYKWLLAGLAAVVVGLAAEYAARRRRGRRTLPATRGRA